MARIRREMGWKADDNLTGRDYRVNNYEFYLDIYP
jgi:hypothetical protein